jgi:hypothetical protein
VASVDIASGDRCVIGLKRDALAVRAARDDPRERVISEWRSSERGDRGSRFSRERLFVG